MKGLFVTLVTLSLASNVQAENLIRMLLNKSSNQPDISKRYKGVSRERVGNSPFYFYKLQRQEEESSKIAIIASNDAPVITLTPQKPAVVSHPDTKPIKRVIDKHQPLDEIGNDAVKEEKNVVYGRGSPLRDDNVIEAWKKADEAQQRLDDHRSYMEKVRQSRKKVEQAKRVSTAANRSDEDGQ